MERTDFAEQLAELRVLYEQLPECNLSAEQEGVLQALLVLVRDTVSTIPILESGYFKLPVVEKEVKVGERGGAYYVNKLGNKVWLKRHQRQQCQEDTLPGEVSGCPAVGLKPYLRHRK